MQRYHVHPVTGEAKACRALKRCPFGDMVADHYPTPQEAREAFEEKMAEVTVAPSLRRKKVTPHRDVALEVLESTRKKLSHPEAQGALQAFKQQVATFESVRDIIVARSRLLHALNETPRGHGPLREALHFNLQMLNAFATYYETQNHQGSQDESLREIQEWKELIEDHEARAENIEAALQEVQDRLQDPEVQGDPDSLSHLQLEELYHSASLKRLEDDLLYYRALVEKNEETHRRREEGGGSNQDLLEDLETLGRKTFPPEEVEVPPGTWVGNEGHRLLVDPPEEEALREEREVYWGRLSSQDERDTVRELEAQASHLLQYMPQDSSGTFTPPTRDWAPPEESGYTFLASGVESNAYLHRESGMVYKIYHQKSEHLQQRRGREQREVSALAHEALLYTRMRYEDVDHSYLQGEGLTYLKTYFLLGETPQGGSFPLQVQPYLDPKIHAPANFYGYDTYAETLEEEGKVSDFHEDNVRVNVVTGEVILFDCVY